MKRLRLRTVLAAVFLLVLALPLAGILALRVYESALVRQTESELIGQAATVAAAYAVLFERQAAGEPGFDLAAYGRPQPAPRQPVTRATDYESRGRLTLRDFEPRPARLDLARDPVLPPPPDPQAPALPADARALAAGQELAPVLRQVQRVTLAGLRVIGPDGTVVASTGEGLGLSLSAQPEVRRALAGEFLTLLRAKARPELGPDAVRGISRGSGLRVFVAVPIACRGRIVGAVLAVRTPASLGAVLVARRGKLAVLGFALLGVTLALAWLTATTVTQPLRRLALQARAAQAGERGALTPVRRRAVREVAELGDTIAAMAQALERRADYIRDFAAHVSHEFKTPLTAIGGAAELLREHGEAMAPEERARFLGIVADDTARLSRLTGRLLELARADMAAPDDGACAALPVLRAAVARAASQHGQRVTLLADALPADARVKLSEEALDALLGTLLDNARVHAPGSAVRVTATLAGAPSDHTLPDGEQADAAPAAGSLRLLVADDGAGVSPANVKRLFVPFFTTARDRGGTGLGLAILRALLTARGGSVRLLSAVEAAAVPGTLQGAVFEVRLPLVA